MKRIPIQGPLGLDWRLVRGLGQLHILNRASLILVIIVPILADIWPTVRHTMAWYDGTLTQIQESLGQIVNHLPERRLRASSDGSNASTSSEYGITQGVRDELHRLTIHIEDLRLQASHLPTSLALLFFASLAVLLGRTIFQLRCPDTVREFQLDDYVRERKREYSESPSLRSVTQAMDYLDQLSIEADLIAEEREVERATDLEMIDLQERLKRAEDEYRELKVHLANVKDKNDRDIGSRRLQGLLDEARQWRDDLRRLVESDRGDRGPDFRRRMSLIELSAAQLYLQEARRTRVAMLLCGICYVIAIVLIIDVFELQALAVAKEVDWPRALPWLAVFLALISALG